VPLWQPFQVYPGWVLKNYRGIKMAPQKFSNFQQFPLFRIRPLIALLHILMMFVLLTPDGALSADKEDDASGGAHEIVAELSDEQVRRLLIEELQKTGSYSEDEGTSLISKGIFSGMLARLENLTGTLYWRISALQLNYVKVPHDIAKAVDYLTERKGIIHFGKILGVLLVIFAAGFGVEKFIGKFTYNKSKWFEIVPSISGLAKLWGAVLKILPSLIGLLLFTGVCLILFLPFFGTEGSGIRPLFVALMAVIITGWLISSFSRMFCSPAWPALRLLPLDDQGAAYLHRSLVLFGWVLPSGYIAIMLLKYAGTWGDSLVLLIIAYGTVVILMFGVMVWRHRTYVASRIRGCIADNCEGIGWFADLFASIWHLMALAYLFIVWFLWSGRLILLGLGFDKAFVISLMIVPIYLIIDRAGNWVISAIIGSLQKGQEPIDGKKANGTESKESQMEIADEAGSLPIARRITRTAIIIGLLLWLLDIWGVEVPFSERIVDVGFNILVTLVLALVAWRILNSFISRKLEDTKSDAEEEADQADDEWGGTATLDRSYTLLPILRKFIGIVLVVMVTLIVLSSMGINIGPLLAGAGVAGLAIGFGAQKLVADVLSGIFYLVDDAFRVGEYIQAGGVSGSVEAITLRNVMLRHHRGMLQIVPFSDLGSITNFMRGGIIVKFNLQFPYDTNVDKVRKIIKKVGKAMLDDPEMGSDFIQPVKSGGVREMGDSVMTIRVKFTAKPGAHFVIRREAYKRITEALEAKGLHYAHRKVIVEVAQANASGAAPSSQQPHDSTGSNSPGLSKDEVLEAGAAAAAESLLNKKQEKKSQT
jgi:moderate conductance mechanosensitive channel